MRSIGFSTGALAFGDFRKALEMVSLVDSNVIELSALRDNELKPLMYALNDLDLHRFEHISIHVPSKFKTLTEQEVAIILLPCIDLKIPIIIHPDIINDIECWKSFEDLLCIENMDNRKPIGRTVAELETFFSIFPKAMFCFDIAHVRQIDQTMNEANQMLMKFGNKLRQIHISQIDSLGSHQSLELESILAIQSISSQIDENIPIIIESVISKELMQQEINSVKKALSLSF